MTPMSKGTPRQSQVAGSKTSLPHQCMAGLWTMCVFLSGFSLSVCHYTAVFEVCGSGSDGAFPGLTRKGLNVGWSQDRDLTMASHLHRSPQAFCPPQPEAWLNLKCDISSVTCGRSGRERGLELCSGRTRTAPAPARRGS